MSFREKLQAKRQIDQIDQQMKEVDFLPSQRKLQEVTKILAEISHIYGYEKVFEFSKATKRGTSDDLAEMFVNRIREVVK